MLSCIDYGAVLPVRSLRCVALWPAQNEKARCRRGARCTVYTSSIYTVYGLDIRPLYARRANAESRVSRHYTTQMEGTQHATRREDSICLFGSAQRPRRAR